MLYTASRAIPLSPLALGEIHPNRSFDYNSLGGSEAKVSSPEFVTPMKDTGPQNEIPMRRASLPSIAIKSPISLGDSKVGAGSQAIASPTIILKPNVSGKKPNGEIGYPPPVGILVHKPPMEAPPREPFGILTITISRAKNLKAGYGPLGKASPFVKVKVGEREYKSESAHQEGRNPHWNQSYDFEITTEKEVELEVLDEQEVGHTFSMGRAKAGILDWMAQGQYEGSIDLLDKQGQICGVLIVKTEFRRNKPSSTQKDVKKSNGSQNYSDDDILDAFRTFDLDKNNYIGAAELRHILLCIGERVTDEEVRNDDKNRMMDDLDFVYSQPRPLHSSCSYVGG